MGDFSGNWSSTQYPGVVLGTAYAKFADMTKGKFLLCYVGEYRHGENVVIEVELDSSGTIGIASQPVHIFQRGTISCQQTIIFTATIFTPEQIIGTYTATGPSDQGVFAMKRLNGIELLPFVESSTIKDMRPIDHI